MTTLRRLQRVLGVLCLAFVGLIVVANTVVHSAPGGFAYFVRGDVAAMLGLATVLAVVLFWASAGDTDRHRASGSIASGTMTGLLLGTVSSATSAPGLCSNPQMTTQAVIERYFELSTSKDPRARCAARGVPGGVRVVPKVPFGPSGED